MQQLFRGYVKTKNKRCLQKFGNGEKLLALDDVKDCAEYAGILSEDIILVDVDDEKESEILLRIVKDMHINSVVYKTTRGRHFYFKNTTVDHCYTGTQTLIGIRCDMKIGAHNSYSVLKFNGVERQIEYKVTDDVDLLPLFLQPIKLKNDIDFIGLKEGDGRNSLLFKYILILQSLGLGKRDIQKILGIINTYVFAQPLISSELNTIMRDDAFKKNVEKPKRDDTMPFYEKGRFKHEDLAVFMNENNKFIKINKQLLMYQDGIYRRDTEYIERVMIANVPRLTAQNRSEVLKYLSLIVDDNKRLADSEFIAFNNTIYNISTDERLDFSPDIVICNKIPHNYNPNAYSEVADRTLNKVACQDKQIRALLEEVIGYTFYRRNELRKAFILTGEKANGKSTFIDMIANLLGHENIVGLDLNELGDRFKTAELFGKLANLGDDIGDDFISNPAVFKKVVSGDMVNAERKGQNPFDFANYAKMIFSANEIPRIKDKTGAVLDRLIIVPFNAKFSKTDPDFDPYIKDKLRSEEVMEYLINIGIEGLRRVLSNKGFTVSDSIKESIDDYNLTNNPILQYLSEEGVRRSDLLGEEVKEFYRQYQAFCYSNGYSPVAQKEFTRQVCLHFDGIRVVNARINQKVVRAFCGNA